MSKMIPQATVDTLRLFTDTSVDLYGIDCKMYVPLNLTAADQNDIYKTVSEINYSMVETLVWIEWAPDVYRLRKLGIYVEDQTPQIAWFKNSLNVVLHSYFSIPLQYIPKTLVGVEEFEVVDSVVKGLHDAIILNCFKIAPRRVKK